MTKSRGIIQPRRRWTEDEIALLKRFYTDMPTKALARQLGMTVAQIYSKADRLKLKKSADYLASAEACRLRRGDNTGAATRFKPGHQTWNKGVHFIAGGRSAETRFKPGHRGGRAAELYQPIGAERISKDGYLERKINDDMPLQKRWRAVHLVIWEKANGPLPPGHAIAFRDGNKQNTALDNLELLSRADLMKRNTIHNYPKEIVQLVRLRGAISQQINKRERKSA